MQPIGRMQSVRAGEHDHRNPEDVGSEEMEHLYPGAGEQQDVGYPERVLEEQATGYAEGQNPVRGNAQPDKDDPEQEGSCDEAQCRVNPAQADEPASVRREVLHEGIAQTCRRVESVAQGSERAEDPYDECGDQSYGGNGWRTPFNAAVHEATPPAEEVRGKRERGKHQQCIGKVQGKVHGTRYRLVMRDFPQEDEQRSEDGLIQRENERDDNGSAGQVAARCSAKGPEDQTKNGNQSDTAHGAMREFDKSGDCGVMLHDRAIAERPVLAAPGTGTGSPYNGTP